MGDLIQGDCNNGTVHAQMAADAFETIKSALGGDLPLRLVVGNHDIRNGAQDSAASSYRSWMTARMAEECGADAASTNFCYRQGPDLWIHVDFTQPSLPFVYEAMARFDPAYVRPQDYGCLQTSADGRSLLGEYQAALVRYVRSSAVGFMRLEVSADGVVARMFGGDATEPFATWTLR